MKIKCKLVSIGVVLSVLLCITLTTGCRRILKLPERINNYLLNNSPDVLKIGLHQEPLNLNPFIVTSDFASIINDLVFASPITEDEDGSFKPLLFESFTTYEDENKNFVVDGIWKQNLKWHDGVDFNPSDLDYTLKKVANSSNYSPYSYLVQNYLVSVQNFDRGRRTRIVFKKKSRQLLKLLTLGIIPSHRILDSNQPITNLTHHVPNYFNQEDLNTLFQKSYFQIKILENNTQIIDFSALPVGLGPYKIIGRLPYRFIELEKYDQSPINSNFQKIIIRIFSKVDELISSLRKGELDVALIPDEISKKISELKFQNILYKEIPNSTYLVWAFNLTKSPFDNIEFRKILCNIVDRKKIIFNLNLNAKEIYNLSLFQNQSNSENNICLANSISNHTQENLSNIIKQSNNVIQTLSENGFSDINNDGWLEYKNQPFEIRILTNNENLLRKMASEIIVENLKKYKIKSHVDSVSWAELVDQIFNTNNYDSFLIALFIPADKNIINLFHSKSPYGLNINFAKFYSSRLDELLVYFDSYLSNTQSSEKILKEIEHEINSNVPVCWLAQMNDLIAIYNNSVTNISDKIPFSSQKIYLWTKQHSDSSKSIASNN